MNIPFIDLSRSTQTIKEKALIDFKACIEKCEFVGGSSVNNFEASLAKSIDVNHALSCANGTDALIISLQALGIKQGDIVALPNMTFWATYEAIAQLGATAVLIDINPSDLHMCLSELKLAHKKYKLTAAVFVHLFGWTSLELTQTRDFCKEEGIYLLEDSAQCFGTKVDGVSIFKEADYATLSFYPAKVLGGISDGGAIVSNNSDFINNCKVLANHGRSEHYSYEKVGWNSRMSAFQASYLRHALDKISENILSRKNAIKFYQEFFSNHSEMFTMHNGPENVNSNGYLCVLESQKAPTDRIQTRLKQEGIGCARTYPETICMQKPAAKSLRISELEKSKTFCKKVINLPLFAGITVDECRLSSEKLVEVTKEVL